MITMASPAPCRAVWDKAISARGRVPVPWEGIYFQLSEGWTEHFSGDKLSPEHEWVLAQLRLVVDWAAMHTAFYAEMLGAKLKSPLANIDDFFERVPILDKPTLARRVDDFTDLDELPS